MHRLLSCYACRQGIDRWGQMVRSSYDKRIVRHALLVHCQTVHPPFHATRNDSGIQVRYLDPEIFVPENFSSL